MEDFCEGVYKILTKGKIGEIYNIGSKFEYKNIDVLKIVAKENKVNFKNYLKHVKDRPFNDYRYSLNFNKVKKIGWRPKTKIEDKIKEINLWYKDNISRFQKR